MNNLVLAYLGDAVYELFIREYLIKLGISKVKDLQEESIKYVSADAQRKIIEKLINENVLKEDEIDIFKRGRNADSHKSKSTDIITYKISTGFECLIGYLYQNDTERLSYISTLRNFYKIKETEVVGELFDINNFNENEIIQIIPQEKKNKFEKNKFTILQIGA